MVNDIVSELCCAGKFYWEHWMLLISAITFAAVMLWHAFQIVRHRPDKQLSD